MIALTKHLVQEDTLGRVDKLHSAELSLNDSCQSDIGNTGLKVCIISAGIAGLYTALLLDTSGIEWKIIEAHPSRLGGRL